MSFNNSHIIYYFCINTTYMSNPSSFTFMLKISEFSAIFLLFLEYSGKLTVLFMASNLSLSIFEGSPMINSIDNCENKSYFV